jgi:stearoyl-CoA desaturase (Delta-9 desaturase)
MGMNQFQAQHPRPSASGGWMTFIRWFDSWAGLDTIKESDPPRVDWLRVVPFLLMHLMCLGVVWVGWSWTAVSVAVGLYLIRMFAITAFYHRYFSHRTFKTSRWGQFLFALLGTTAIQRGPLWWAAHHRHHHRSSDQSGDRHSPHRHGFLWSHVGWFTARVNFRTNLQAVHDFARFPELCFLDRFDIVVAVVLAVSIYVLGAGLETLTPHLGTNGMQLLIWGFFISTVVLYHATYTINSLAHQIGRQRYDTGDKSGNSFLLSLITLGEGWHNNHHHYPAAVRQGFYWWEIDPTYYLLKVLAWIGLIWDLKPVPPHIRETRRLDLVTEALP